MLDAFGRHQLKFQNKQGHVIPWQRIGIIHHQTMISKITQKVLRDDALLEYIRRDSKSKTMEEDVVDLIDDTDECLQVKRKVDNLQYC